MTKLVGLPDGEHFTSEVGIQFFSLWEGEIRSVAAAERLRYATKLPQQRTPHDLGGMGREDQFDLEGADQMMQIFRRDAGSNE